MNLSGKTIIFLFSLILCLSLRGTGQTNLSWYIEQAAKNSLNAQQSQTAFQLAQANFKTFQLTNKPSLSVYGNIPSYNKDNYAVTQPDGSIRFLPRSQNYSNAGIGFTQPIGLTGGSLSVNTDLYRFDNFTDKTKQYNGTPFFVRLSQPLFKYIPWKWEKKIAPLKLIEAFAEQKQQQRQIAYEVCRLYFDVVEAQVNAELASVNRQHTSTNLGHEKRRQQLGTSTDDKVMQLEMQLLNSEQAKASATFAVTKNLLLLRIYVNSTDTTLIELQLPEELPSLPNNNEQIITTARQHLPLFLAAKRKKTELLAKDEEAKKQGRQIDLVASYGFNNSSPNLAAIYTNPQNQQRFSIGINIPVADWGRRKNAIAVNQLTAKQNLLTQQQQEANWLAEVKNLLTELQLLRQNIYQQCRIDTLAQKRFAVANRLFQPGKISLLELQAAQNEKDNARRNYVLALRLFWEGWYLLKVKTGMAE